MDKKSLVKKPSEKRIQYPIGSEYYSLYEEIGQGVSALVHRALCNPLNEIVAIKILDFERDKCDLDRVSREAQIMVLVNHLNVLKSHCSFVCDQNLWVVMPYMAGGSCLHILKAAHPDGLREVVIATVLREVLKGLEYLHDHGYIHRDVKAGNILIDSRGGIKLGDFGVSAYLFDSGDRQRIRNTFVGTPCWMAPEVMEQLHGYDRKADIWSFGITALELAHGHAPFSKYPPMKVLLMTLQNAPPGLDYERDKKFSKNEYKRGISSWNFNLEDLKAQASLIPDEEILGENDQGGSTNSLPGLDNQGNRLQNQLSSLQLPKFQHQFSFGSQNSDATGFEDDNPSAPPSPADRTMTYSKAKNEKFDDDLSIASSIQDAQMSQNSSPCYEEMNVVGKGEHGTHAGAFEGIPINSCQRDKSSSQNISSCNVAFPQTSDDLPAEIFIKPSRTSAGSSEDFDEKTKYQVVQQRGRFKVTSENVDVEKVTPEHLATTQPLPPDATPANLSSQSIFPLLQNALQATITGTESILSAMRQVTRGDSTANGSVDLGCIPSNSVGVEKSLLEAALDREKELIRENNDLRLRLLVAQEELQKYKTENKSSK